MPPQSHSARWAYLQDNAHRPDVQVQIRKAIQVGVIRVVSSGDGITIIPTLTRLPAQEWDAPASRGPALRETSGRSSC